MKSLILGINLILWSSVCVGQVTTWNLDVELSSGVGYRTLNDYTTTPFVEWGTSKDDPRYSSGCGLSLKRHTPSWKVNPYARVRVMNIAYGTNQDSVHYVDELGKPNTLAQKQVFRYQFLQGGFGLSYLHGNWSVALGLDYNYFRRASYHSIIDFNSDSRIHNVNSMVKDTSLHRHNLSPHLRLNRSFRLKYFDDFSVFFETGYMLRSVFNNRDNKLMYGMAGIGVNIFAKKSSP